MLSPSDFNSAVPQFTNGNYASNPVNPQYIAEPSSTDYNRGTEPLQTLPAQWWNWFLNKFTSRFNKLNVYVKNIFNELSQLLSLSGITPDGTEGTPTVEQLKTMFACCYPSYVKETEGLVPNTTTVNGHALTGNVSVTRSDLGLGTSATVNTGSGAGCIPTVGTALGSTANKIVLTTASGTLQPSSSTVGSAAYCDASCFRASTWTPSLVSCACCGKNGSTYSAFGSNAFNSTAFTTCTGTVTQVKVGSTAYNPSSGVISLPEYPTTPTTVTNANKICTTVATANSDRNLIIGEATYTGTCCAGVYVGNSCKATFNPATGVLKATCFCGTASCASCATYLYCNGARLSLVCTAPSVLTILGDYNLTGVDVRVACATCAITATTATCACRIDVISQTWKIVACGTGGIICSIANCCDFPIFAFASSDYGSDIIYLKANQTISFGTGNSSPYMIGRYSASYFTIGCGVRLF